MFYRLGIRGLKLECEALDFFSGEGVPQGTWGLQGDHGGQHYCCQGLGFRNNGKEHGNCNKAVL